MKYEVEFRISERAATSLLGPGVGRRLGSGTTRKVVAEPGDPVYEAIRGEELRRRASGEPGLFTAWIPHRRYQLHELEAAPLLRWEIATAFEPIGEDCGTVYDYGAACPLCGTGRVQRSPLRLDLRRIQPSRDVDTRTIPASKDAARTIAEEVVVTRRFRDIVSRDLVTGVNLAPVEDRGRTSGDWFQLVVVSQAISIVPPTEFGIDPFDADVEGRYRCPRGHVAGLNLLSEVTIDPATWDGSDVVASRELVGRRAGDLVPAPLLFVSNRLWTAMRSQRLRGSRFEPALFSSIEGLRREV